MRARSVTSVNRNAARPKGRPYVVAKQSRAEWTLRWRQCGVDDFPAEHVALNDEDVEVAVVVEVQQRDARRHDFRVVEVAGHAVEVGEVQARFIGAIDEPLRRRATVAVFSAGLHPARHSKRRTKQRAACSRGPLMLLSRLKPDTRSTEVRLKPTLR